MKTYLIFAMFVSSMLFLLPLQRSYETSMGDIQESVHMPKIGFLTVGDNFQVTLTITNNYTETKYFKTVEWWRPYQITGSFTGEKYEDDYTYQVSPSSTLIINRTFTAAFPDLWTLIVRADGFDNSTRLGIVDPSYANDTNYYVHPSSDQDIRILAESMRNSSIAAENNLNEVKQQGIFITISALATAALAGFVFWQTREIRTQTKLAHMPYLTPRFQMAKGPIMGEFPLLLIANVGHGPALKIKVQVVDILDNPISKELGFHALFPQDERSLGVNLTEHPKYKLKGYYYDLIGTRHDIENIEHSYPPSYE